jgi:predicted ester cyclase
MKTNHFQCLLLILIAAGFSACSPKEKEASDNAQVKEIPSTSRTNKMVTEKLFTIVQTNAVDSLSKYIDDKMVEHSPVPNGASTGIQSQKDAIAFYYRAFPDWKFTVLSTVAEGDFVMAHFNVKATNTGAMGTVPATNKPVDVNGVDVYKFENGKVVEHWGYFEEGKMMMQLGLMGEQKTDAKKK